MITKQKQARHRLGRSILISLEIKDHQSQINQHQSSPSFHHTISLFAVFKGTEHLSRLNVQNNKAYCGDD